MSLKQTVVNILMGGEVDKIPPFTVSGTTIYPIYYKSLGARISMFNSVKIVYSTYYGQARYIPKKNKMYLGFQSVTPYLKSLVIHEATHAVCDMIKAPMSFSNGEVMAFVAQSVYFKANNAHLTLTATSDSKMAAILEKSNLVADTILSGGTPSFSDYEDVRTKIQLHEDYSEMALLTANFNGLADED